MSAYYNEIDPFAAQWLRNLISAGHIAPGDVDERSIEDVKPDDLRKYTQCHFFAGIGVWSHALRSAGWSDDRPVWTGSCPCQPFSAAGKGAGFDDERHLWPAFYHLISECRPSVVFGEQVASKDGLKWLDLVQSDLEVSGYAVGAADTCAAGVGAPHLRQRLYWVADTDSKRQSGINTLLLREKSRRLTQNSIEVTGSSEIVRLRNTSNGKWANPDWLFSRRDKKWRPVEPGTFPLANGTSSRVGRLRAYGNAINAEQARFFIAAYLDATLAIFVDSVT